MKKKIDPEKKRASENNTMHILVHSTTRPSLVVSFQYHTLIVYDRMEI